jgi:type IX secretion system PorP/SprF family membrane protein
MKKASVTIIFLFFLSLCAEAQQEMRFTQYMFNLYQVNSAYAGSRETLSLAGIVRSQWTGLDGAPQMQSLTMNTPLLTRNIGIGIKFRNESAGASSQTLFAGSFAYRFRLLNGKLAFGLSAGLLNNRFNWSKAEFKDPSDQLQSSGTENTYTPTFDFSGYFYTNTFYLGFQVDNLNQSQIKILADGDAKNYIHSTIIVGKAIALSKKVVFKPSALFRTTQAAQQFEVNVSFLFNETLWAGITFRSDTELSLILEYNINQKLRFGYSFDYAIKPVQSNSAGSHEFFVGYDIQVKNKNMASPRYF